MVRSAFLIAAAFVLIPSFAQADFQAGNWELTLGGSGASNKGISQGSFAASGSLGYFVTKDIEIALRQGLGYSHFKPGGETITASTRVAADYHFDLGNWRPFVGANIGYSYGTHGVLDTGEFAPEAGVKYFLNSTTFVYGMAEYQIFFRNNKGATFDKGSFVYGLGLGVVLK